MATYKEKMQQANREAGASVVAAVVVAVAWAVLGYGLAGSGIVVFSLPLWIVAGCAGTWLVATAASAILSHFVITDVPLDDEDEAVDEDGAEGLTDGEVTADDAVCAPVASDDGSGSVKEPESPCHPTGASPARFDSSEA